MLNYWSQPRWRETRLLGTLQLCLVHNFLSAVRIVLLGLWGRSLLLSSSRGRTYALGRMHRAGVLRPSCTVVSHCPPHWTEMSSPWKLEALQHLVHSIPTDWSWTQHLSLSLLPFLVRITTSVTQSIINSNPPHFGPEVNLDSAYDKRQVYKAIPLRWQPCDHFTFVVLSTSGCVVIHGVQQQVPVHLLLAM